jgi:nucleoside-diphosphate-sugar epimerase
VFAAPVQPVAARRGEVVVTGGTGFLGRYLVPLLLAAGHPVTLLVRRPQFLPEALRDARIRVLVGDARDRDAVLRAVEGATAVVHMATCAAGPGEQPEESMSAGARAVGEACLQAGVERFVFVSSTAALYLGGRGPVRGSEAPDPRPRRRAEYSRGKIAAERTLRDLEADRGLRLVILRPAIVVGEGGSSEHSGVGLWVRDNHCVGWGLGAHPLPFVLVRDCAAAIAQSLSASDVVGKAYNLAGPVRPSARDWVALLRRRTGRDYHFHPQPGSCVTYHWCWLYIFTIFQYHYYRYIVSFRWWVSTPFIHIFVIIQFYFFCR